MIMVTTTITTTITDPIAPMSTTRSSAEPRDHRAAQQHALRRLPTADVCSTVRRCRNYDELDVLFEPAVNIVVLERALPEALRVDALAVVEQLKGGGRMWTVDPCACTDQQLLDQLGSAPVLTQDIGRCIELFADLTDADVVGLRLAHLATAMCPRFHVDRVTLRMVVSYLGAATEYVDGDSFDRSTLGARRADESSQAAADGVLVQRARAGDVVLLKGEAWPGNAGLGAIHRSPAASLQSPRLVLTMDAL